MKSFLPSSTRSKLISRFGMPTLLAVATLPCPTATADEVQLQLLSTGATPKLGGYMPQRLTLSAEKPGAIKQLPADLTAPLFGVLTLGPKESPTAIAVVLDEPEGTPSRLFVDANGNNDLTDDPPAEWNRRPYKSPTGAEFNQASGGATVQIAYGLENASVHLPMYRFDKSDPTRAALKGFLFYYSDYARTGEIALGEKKYNALLADNLATGDFRGKTDEARDSGVKLFLDVNGDGKFDRRYESYDVRQPFNIGGTTYEIAGLTASGDKLKIEKSSKTVAEVAVPATLGAGKKALTFKTKTTAGQDLDFPSSYKGKLVLLDFWATWCGPCIGELPNLTAMYEKFHPKGLEVLGISLDQPDAAQKLASFTKEKNMSWPQVYDGKYWQAEIAKLYNVDSIPRAFLVDGDTGEILATGESLRGPELEKTIGPLLAKKMAR
jgi:thiol-disulfide isomerase/thioredoxin